MKLHSPGASKENDLVSYATTALPATRTWPFPFGFNFLPGKRNWRRHIHHESYIFEKVAGTNNALWTRHRKFIKAMLLKETQVVTHTHTHTKT